MFTMSAAERAPLLWALGLILTVPLVLMILTEAIVRLRHRKHALESSLRILREQVLPTLALYFLLTRVVQLDTTSTLARIVLTIVWIVGIHAALSLCNVVVFAGAEVGTWQAKVPTLARDLGRMLLVVVGAGVVLSRVWGTDLGALVTALGVGSLVIGLALQEPLGNLFSGILLTVERPLEVGDWVRVNDTVGRVIEINWRAVHLLVGGTQVVVVPNSFLAKGSFANLSRPTRKYRDALVIGFDYAAPPNQVRAVLLEVARGIPAILPEPGPSVSVDSYGPSAIQYRISFEAADFPEVGSVKELLLTRIWYAAQRHGLIIPIPSPAPRPELNGEEGQPLPEETLRLFTHLGLSRPEGLGPTLSRAAVRRYAAGERIVGKGEPLPGLYLILSGKVVLSGESRTLPAAPGPTANTPHEIARLGPGEFFGERALLTAGSSDVSAVALDDVEILLLEADMLHRLVEESPRVVREIGQVMDARRRALRPVANGLSSTEVNR
jgi:small-conductance mechanosensitive channel